MKVPDDDDDPSNDAAVFSIAAGTLSVSSTLDFENPRDANSDNVYEFAVVAGDGNGNKTLLDVTVKVTDDGVTEWNTLGTLSDIFNLQPEVGTPLFLEDSRKPVTDSDGGVRNIKWQWARETGTIQT